MRTLANRIRQEQVDQKNEQISTEYDRNRQGQNLEISPKNNAGESGINIQTGKARVPNKEFKLLRSKQPSQTGLSSKGKTQLCRIVLIRMEQTYTLKVFWHLPTTTTRSMFLSALGLKPGILHFSAQSPNKLSFQTIHWK